jgi:hypothetical protein
MRHFYLRLGTSRHSKPIHAYIPPEDALHKGITCYHATFEDHLHGPNRSDRRFEFTGEGPCLRSPQLCYLEWWCVLTSYYPRVQKFSMIADTQT